MSMECIRQYYGVPAKRGTIVKLGARTGPVASAKGGRIMVRWEGKQYSQPCHPTDLEWVRE